MTGAIAVLLVLGGLIFFHELGHFLFARLFGVGVRIFSLGFGPKLVGFTRGKTEYRVSAVPLGGYVAMVGEQADEPLPEGFTAGESFTRRPAWQRMCIIAAGPVFNFVLAFLIYWFLFASQGQTLLLAVVGGVQDNSPALEAGLAPGDRIAAIDGKPIRYWQDMSEIVSASEGREMTMTVERDGSNMTVPITPRIMVRKNLFGEDTRVSMIGVAAAGQTVTQPVDAGDAFSLAGEQTWTVISVTAQSLVKLVERIIPLETIGGPIMIAQMVSQQAKEGLTQVLALAAVISINLGLLNLLPIPVLDGGHILFSAIETVTGRPISKRWQAITIRIGMLFLLALMALAIYNDVTRIIFQGS